MDQELVARAVAWADADPDPATARALRAAIAAGDEDVLRGQVGADLAFGTAGLRGEVGPGPNRMNRAVVVRATRGVAVHLLERVDRAAERGVVVGFDARPDSERFAHDVIAVLQAAGVVVRAFLVPTATPLVAFAARRFGAAGAIVVTASHNPPADNGYKVYDEHGVQITTPTDQRIAAAIAEVGPADEVPGVGDGIEGVDVLGRATIAAYRETIDGAWPRPTTRSESPVTVAVTPLHGVGGAPVEAILVERGHRVVRVEDQWHPDGTFPTVAFPNPEEPGALDLAMAAATAADADVVLANDPDADRLAVAIPDGDGGWRRLTGDEVGAILAHHLLARTAGHVQRPLVANSIVSSARLGRIAAAFGARHEVTLTGFKWLWRAGRELADDGWQWVMGYEEALGYSLGTAVRDKDGIHAAAVMADLVSALAADGRRLADLLDDLDDAYGRWANVQAAVRRTGPGGGEEILAAVDAAVGVGEDDVGVRAIRRVVDHRVVGDDAPPWLGATPLVVWHLDGGGRVLVRPSGTEPKLKVYVDLPLRDDEDHAVAAALADHAVELLGMGA